LDVLVKLWPRICTGVVDYGFEISLRRLEPPKTGIFNGEQILLDPDQDLEQQCFTLLHLFGHSVQWVAPTLRRQLDGIQSRDDFERFMTALRAYEFGAARYGLQLLHEQGFRDLDPWLSDFVEADWRYVEHFYRTGQLGDMAQFAVRDAKLIQPAPIPPLRHCKVEPQFSF
jgi:hypothetical protein